MLNVKKIVGLLCALGLVGCGAPEFEQAPAEGVKGVEVGQKEQEAFNSTDVAEGRPVSRNTAAGLVQVVRATDNRIYTSEQNGLVGGWTGWRAVGTNTFPANPTLARYANGTLAIFVVNSAGAVQMSRQTTALGAWSAWTSLGGAVAGRVGVARNGDGRLQLFARGTNGAVFTLAQTAANGAWATTWTSLGGSAIASDPVAIRNGNGRLQVFVRNTSNVLLTLQQSAVNGAWPTTWTSLGSPYYGNPSVSLDSLGRIAVFARGANNALFHTQQSAAGATTWTAWFSLGGSLVGDPSVHRYNTSNLLSVVVRSPANGLQALDQLTATTWSAWANLGVDGAVAGSPTFFTNEGALPALFFRDTTGNIVYNEAYSDGFATYWTGYYYIGNPLNTQP
jgi:hypothetical protein